MAKTICSLMNRRVFFLLSFLSLFAHWTCAQVAVDQKIHIVVDLVQLNVAVTDKKGNYVTGLRPEDFEITEDRIPQKLATFGEGNEQVIGLADTTVSPNQAVPQNDSQGSEGAQHISQSELRSLLAGANVFVLFDTSNYMYRGFVFAQDAIADFVRSLESADKVAFYSYSRDLSRNTLLTPDRGQVLRGVRTTVAGDDAALYNALLMTVKDAGQ